MSILGIRFANMLLFVLSCFLAADIINRVAAFRLIPDERPATEVAAPGPEARLPWSKRQLILERNLFGAQVVADAVAVVEVDPEEDLQKTKLPLRLLGTVASDDQVVASAAIENTTDRVHQVVRVGYTLEKFSDVVVARIDRGRVVLQNGKQREELLLDDDGRTPSVTRSQRPARRTSRRRTPPQPSPSPQQRLEELVQSQGSRSSASVFSDARILPKYASGKMMGVELSQIKSDSLFEKIGLKNGDVVTSINGMLINDPSAQKELLLAFTSAEELVAEVTAANGTTRQIRADAAMLGNMMSGGK
ncbi:MAG: hypothetical protein NZ990_06010 [Myxococcota bacterium]|nr:hypothetical protein [Myxococcota bacterium]